MYIDLIEFNLTKLMHFKEIVARVAFLRFMYVVAYFMIKVTIENVKLKVIFNSNAKMNYMSK